MPISPEVQAARQRLLADLARNAAATAALEADHAHLIDAAWASNADDEHDPEGATLAFEREQVTAMLERLRRGQAELRLSLANLEQGRYGICERCAQPIAPERLEARPHARLCISCARSPTPP